MKLVAVKKKRAIFKCWMRSFWFLCGVRLKVIGRENLNKDLDQIYVANHASYIDPAILVAVLPSNVSLVGKEEITASGLLGYFGRELQYQYVNRFDFTKSTDEINRLGKSVHNQSLVIFPEGTFSYATGLRPFKLGAFKIAVDAQKPVTPIALDGTRKILRGDDKLLRPGKITISIGQSLAPMASSWDEVVRLNKGAREFMAKHCGEPEIAIIAATPADI